jgi:hypothetical protein
MINIAAYIIAPVAPGQALCEKYLMKGMVGRG